MLPIQALTQRRARTLVTLHRCSSSFFYFLILLKKKWKQVGGRPLSLPYKRVLNALLALVTLYAMKVFIAGGAAAASMAPLYLGAAVAGLLGFLVAVYSTQFTCFTSFLRPHTLLAQGCRRRPPRLSKIYNILMYICTHHIQIYTNIFMLIHTTYIYYILIYTVC